MSRPPTPNPKPPIPFIPQPGLATVFATEVEQVVTDGDLVVLSFVEFRLHPSHSAFVECARIVLPMVAAQQLSEKLAALQRAEALNAAPAASSRKN